MAAKIKDLADLRRIHHTMQYFDMAHAPNHLRTTSSAFYRMRPIVRQIARTSLTLSTPPSSAVAATSSLLNTRTARGLAALASAARSLSIASRSPLLSKRDVNGIGNGHSCESIVRPIPIPSLASSPSPSSLLYQHRRGFADRLPWQLPKTIPADQQLPDSASSSQSSSSSGGGSPKKRRRWPWILLLTVGGMFITYEYSKSKIMRHIRARGMNPKDYRDWAASIEIGNTGDPRTSLSFEFVYAPLATISPPLPKDAQAVATLTFQLHDNVSTKQVEDTLTKLRTANPSFIDITHNASRKEISMTLRAPRHPGHNVPMLLYMMKMIPQTSFDIKLLNGPELFLERSILAPTLPANVPKDFAAIDMLGGAMSAKMKVHNEFWDNLMLAGFGQVVRDFKDRDGIHVKFGNGREFIDGLPKQLKNDPQCKQFLDDIRDPKALVRWRTEFHKWLHDGLLLKNDTLNTISTSQMKEATSITYRDDSGVTIVVHAKNFFPVALFRAIS